MAAILGPLIASGISSALAISKGMSNAGRTSNGNYVSVRPSSSATGRTVTVSSKPSPNLADRIRGAAYGLSSGRGLGTL